MRAFYLLILVLSFYTQAQVTEVTYMGADDVLAQYNSELLAAVIKHSRSDVEVLSVKRYAEKIPHHRAFIFLEKNQGIDIVVGYATKERDHKYLAIPIPLLKGLNGWRIPLVHQDNTDIFKDVDTLAAFKKFRAGQYHSWTDAKILKHNDISIVNGSDYEGLFSMLNQKRFEYFPRSIMVAEQEVLAFAEMNKLKIVLDPHILIHYPTASYLYVNKKNIKLAQALTQGLEEIIKNGKFNEIFTRYFGQMLKRIKREKRDVFHLNNHLLPASVPIKRKELWINF